MKLDMQHKHIINLIDRDKDDSGWTAISASLFPVLSENIPKELAVFEVTERGGKAKLTTEGENLLSAMKWL